MPWSGTLSVLLHIILDFQGVGIGLCNIGTVCCARCSIGCGVVIVLCDIALPGCVIRGVKLGGMTLNSRYHARGIDGYTGISLG